MTVPVTLLDEIELGILVLDLDRSWIRYANHAARTALELVHDGTPPELCGMRLFRPWLSIATPGGRRVFAHIKRLPEGQALVTIPPPRRDDDLVSILRATFGLSQREAQVAALVRRGLPNQEIASQLGLALATVKTYMTEVLAAVGVRSRTELIVALDPIR
jgi:DNA-binding CsgD family transcriptional regulator